MSSATQETTKRAERRRLAVELAQISERLFRAGLLATAQKFQPAVKEVGYEIERVEAAERRGK